ncbi:transcriptional regulator [Blastococcus sp. CT_GayMR16]|uniref:transcriptional regulator n=1 Tax=Blastococcus sp. CT_GayMR16 TaxID=2559607 RepID=UPI001073B381|nr:transcriptional regulator [Blastococcus sp. CT_GayMR16]TFV89413.1 transcriptional regulator [Blastococcus sp. CT_GayMR16]
MRARGHGAARRWAAVGVLIAALLALPAVIRTLPASDADVPAAELRARALASESLGFSGYAVSAGSLALPITDQLSSVADLFSDRTTMRVWWRGATDNRVDVVTPAGETGTHTGSGATWTWEYESATATRAAANPLELPAPPDLLPSSLGRRLLSEASADELSRLGARRVAGRDALGLRLSPAAEAASVSRVDVWVDAETGLPLQVEVVEKGAARAAMDTRFLDLDLAVPAPEVTAFTPPPSARIREGREAEVVLEAGRRIRPVELPAELAGLPRRRLDGVPSGIGLYGSGVTLLAVAPVPHGLANGLRSALSQSPDAVVDELGTRVAAGPVALMVVEPPNRGPYVLTGTVTLDALAAAATQLPDLVGGP